MQFVVAALLILAIHLAIHVPAWTGVALLADDRFSVGMGAFFAQQGTPWTERLGFLLAPPLAPGATGGLYRPFSQLLFLLEYPWFGVDAFGYHVVSSLLHCGTGLIWFVLVRRWTGAPAAALAAALLFVGWPGHSEATHWISARINVLAFFFASCGLLFWDGAIRGAGPRLRRCVTATAFAILALGSKESGIVFLPFAALVGALRTPAGAGWVRRAARRALWLLLPTAATAAWLWLRSRALQTWGTTSWQIDPFAPATWLDGMGHWLRLLLAPVHGLYGAAWNAPALWLLHGGVVLSALSAWRRRELRPMLAFGLLAVAVMLVATAGLRAAEGTHENIRHSYELALCFALVLGVGIAHLPARARGPALAALVAVHAITFVQNRECWLRASAVSRRMEQDLHARAEAGPIRVFDVPAAYEGGVIYLVDYPAVFLSPPFAPVPQPGTIASTEMWRRSLRELAAAAAAGHELDNTVTVAWADGELLPESVSDLWPARPWPDSDVSICYARVGRRRPTIPGPVPVQLLVSSKGPLQIEARLLGPREVRVASEFAGAPQPRPLALDLELPGDLDPSAEHHIELTVRRGGEVRAFDLGAVRVVPR